MPLFRRKPTDLVEDAGVSVDSHADAVTETAAPGRGYTAPKGRGTPKRANVGRRVVPPPANAREAAQRRREARRAARIETSEGMSRGDERYLLPRDKGEERLLVRNLVDRRRTVGTWFLGVALVVIIGSSAAMPPVIRLAANLLWAVLALAMIIDAFFLARTIRKTIRQRYPKTGQRMRSLYFYGIMRSITFRRMRMPKPQVSLGDPL